MAVDKICYIGSKNHLILPSTPSKMFHNLKNTVKDLMGTSKTIMYRVFREHKWCPRNPMFNVVIVEPGTEAIFEEFLRQSQQLSGKLNTPISVGPYKVDDQPIYLYTTYYASTWKFFLVTTGLFLTRISAKRSKAIKDTSWTYCCFKGTDQLPELEQVYVVGIKGDWKNFVDTLGGMKGKELDCRKKKHKGQASDSDPASRKDGPIVATNQMIFDARGKVNGDAYMVMKATSENHQKIEDYAKKGQGIYLYEATKLA